MSQAKRYSTTVYIGNGKRKYVSAKTERELAKKVRQLKNDVDQGADLQSLATFDHWAKRWLKETKVNQVGAGTLQQYQAAIMHLNSQFTGIEFKDIKLADFQRFINEYSSTKSERTRKEPSKASIMNVIKVYNAIAEYALESDIPGAKPFRKISINKNAPVKARRALTEEEIQWIIDTEDRAQIAAMVMLFAGLRRGELVPLQWSDIDLVNGVINLKRFASVEKSSFVLKPEGKSAAAKRRIPMPPVLVDYLKEYRKSHSLNSVLVCPQKSGAMQSPKSFDNMMKHYVKALNYKYGFPEQHELRETVGKKDLPMMIEPFTSHYLRHTFATLLYLQGVPAATAMQYLGHSNIQMTINVYTDLEQYYKFELPESFKQKLETEYKVRTA